MFGDILKQARKSKGLRQKELASIIKNQYKIDVSHNSISNWENDRHNPDPELIPILCEILNIEPNVLYSEIKGWPPNVETKKFLTDPNVDQLPEEAKKEIDNFMDYLKIKYKVK